MLNLYFNPFAATTNIPVYRMTRQENDTSGLKPYSISTFLVKGFIKRVSQKEAFKQGIPNTGRDIQENSFILTQTELKTTGLGFYADVIKWDNLFWEVSSVMKNTVSGIFYEAYAGLITDVPEGILDIQNATN